MCKSGATGFVGMRHAKRMASIGWHAQKSYLINKLIVKNSRNLLTQGIPVL